MDKKNKEKVEEVQKCDDCEGWMEKHHKYIGKRGHGGGGSGAVYGLGFVGALIYYFQHSVVTMDYVYGLLKALVWPAFLIHKVFTLLGM